MSRDDIIERLRAENLALAERLRQRPEIREVIGELRDIRELIAGERSELARVARARMQHLLCRLDLESGS